MGEMQIFSNPEFGQVRVVERDGVPWFVGKDVAELLGYKNTKDALLTHVDEDDKRIIQRSEIATFECHIPKNVFPVEFVNGNIPNRGLTFINESGVYSLILSSKLPKAKQFKQNGQPLGQKRLFNWMRENGYLIKRQGADYNSPTQKAMELGLFKIKETAITHADGHVSISKTVKVTGKGQTYFVNKFLGQQGV